MLLPARRLEALLGRQVELERSVNAIIAMTPISLHGVGGIGKTELALHVMYDEAVAAKFGERRFVSCEGIVTTAELRQRIAEKVGLEPPAGERGFSDAALAAALDARRASTLLVIDNFEDTLHAQGERDDAERFVLALLDVACVALVITCRSSPIPVGDSRWLRAGGADQPMERLDQVASRALFRTSCAVADADLPHLDALIESVGGHPLALKLLALRTQSEGDDLRTTLARFTAGIEYAARSERASTKDFSIVASLRLSLESPRVAETVEPQQLLRILALLESGIAKADLGKIGLPERSWMDGAERLLAVGLVHISVDRKCVRKFPTPADARQAPAPARHPPLGPRASQVGHQPAGLGGTARGVGAHARQG